MSDDWRLQIDFRDDGPADALHDRLDAKHLEHDLSEAFHDGVIVSNNGTTRARPGTGRKPLSGGRRGGGAGPSPLAPDRRGLETRRRADARRAGPPVARRWKYLLIGAIDEEQAKELAERIRSEAPPGSETVAEGSWRAAYGEVHRPFAFLGGLGG